MSPGARSERLDRGPGSGSAHQCRSCSTSAAQRGRRGGMISLTKHAQEAISVRGIAFPWIEEAVSHLTLSKLIHDTRSGRDPTKPSPNSAAECYGLCIDQRAMIRDHHSAFRSRSPAMIRTSYDPEADAMFVWFGPE